MSKIEFVPNDSIDKVFKGFLIEQKCREYINHSYKSYDLENSLINFFRIALELYEKECFYNDVAQVLSWHFVDNTPVNLLPNNVNTQENFDRLHQSLMSYINVIDCANSFLAQSLSKLRYKYSLRHYEDLVISDMSIINNNDSIFSLSPLLMSISIWKKLVNYELSIITPKRRKFEIIRMISNLKELIARIDSNFIFNLNDFLYPDLEDESYEIGIYFGQTKGEAYKKDLNEYIEYLEALDYELIDYNIKKELIGEIKKSMNDDKKIKVCQDYSLKELLKFFNSSVINKEIINSRNFLLKYTDVKTSFSEVNLNDSIEEKLSRESFEDFALLIKYLKERKVIVSSDRVISKVLKIYTQIDLSEESIRKLISQKSNKNLSQKLKANLNYYLL